LRVGWPLLGPLERTVPELAVPASTSVLVRFTPDNPAGHMRDARCGSAPANYSAVVSDTVRGDVHELTLRLSPGSPAEGSRHACDCIGGFS
jgi:hypothetical protein